MNAAIRTAQQLEAQARQAERTEDWTTAALLWSEAADAWSEAARRGNWRSTEGRACAILWAHRCDRAATVAWTVASRV